jgi:hypothetical protein
MLDHETAELREKLKDRQTPEVFLFSREKTDIYDGIQ